MIIYLVSVNKRTCLPPTPGGTGAFYFKNTAVQKPAFTSEDFGPMKTHHLAPSHPFLHEHLFLGQQIQFQSSLPDSFLYFSDHRKMSHGEGLVISGLKANFLRPDFWWTPPKFQLILLRLIDRLPCWGGFPLRSTS